MNCFCKSTESEQATHLSSLGSMDKPFSHRVVSTSSTLGMAAPCPTDRMTLSLHPFTGSGSVVCVMTTVTQLPHWQPLRQLQLVQCLCDKVRHGDDHIEVLRPSWQRARSSNQFAAALHTDSWRVSSPVIMRFCTRTAPGSRWRHDLRLPTLQINLTSRHDLRLLTLQIRLTSRHELHLLALQISLTIRQDLQLLTLQISLATSDPDQSHQPPRPLCSVLQFIECSGNPGRPGHGWRTRLGAALHSVISAEIKII